MQGSIYRRRAGRKRRGASEHAQSCLHKMSTHCPYPRPGRGAKTMEGGRCHFPVPRTVLEAPAWVAVLPRSPRCLWVAPSLSGHRFLICEIRMLLPPQSIQWTPTACARGPGVGTQRPCRPKESRESGWAQPNPQRPGQQHSGQRRRYYKRNTKGPWCGQAEAAPEGRTVAASTKKGGEGGRTGGGLQPGREP